MGVTFPGESAEYRAARDRLLEQEAEMRRAVEAVAAARRELPPGGAVPEDYVFHGAGRDGAPTEVSFSELFAPGKDTLVIYSMMFPRAPDEDCRVRRARSSCDSFDGVGEHASQRVNVAVVAKARAAAPARPRRRARLAAAAPALVGRQRLQPRLPRGNDGRRAAAADAQRLRRHGDADPPLLGLGAPLAPADPGQDPRHAETIDPLWNLFDFAPEGRGTDWYPALSY